MSKTLGSFKLHIQEGSFSGSEILVMLGENGTGKTTFIKMLAGMLPADGEMTSQVGQEKREGVRKRGERWGGGLVEG
jgi:translation initiation factor RLI1